MTAESQGGQPSERDEVLYRINLIPHVLRTMVVDESGLNYTVNDFPYETRKGQPLYDQLDMYQPQPLDFFEDAQDLN